MINSDGTFTCDYCQTNSNDSEDGHGVFLEYRGNHWSCNEIAKLRSDLADAKARAKTAEENWHKNEARIAWLLENIKSARHELLVEDNLTNCMRILTAALKGVA